MAATRSALIVLDRDGVLNAPVPNPAEPRPDSPLRAEEVERVPVGARACCATLTRAGFGLAIASNQPAAAKGKTTRAELRGGARGRRARGDQAPAA